MMEQERYIIYIIILIHLPFSLEKGNKSKFRVVHLISEAKKKKKRPFPVIIGLSGENSTQRKKKPNFRCKICRTRSQKRLIIRSLFPYLP